MSKNMSWISLEEKNRDEGKNKNKIVNTNKKMNELQMQMTRKKAETKKEKNFFKKILTIKSMLFLIFDVFQMFVTKDNHWL